MLSDPLAQELTHSSIPARLAYLGPDGFPRAIPIGFHCTGAPFVRCTVPHAPTVPALNTNPKAALTVGTNAFPPHVLLVRGTAAVDIVEGVPPEYLITPLWAKLLDFQTRFPTRIEQLLRRTS